MRQLRTCPRHRQNKWREQTCIVVHYYTEAKLASLYIWLYRSQTHIIVYYYTERPNWNHCTHHYRPTEAKLESLYIPLYRSQTRIVVTSLCILLYMGQTVIVLVHFITQRPNPHHCTYHYSEAKLESLCISLFGGHIQIVVHNYHYIEDKPASF